MDKIIIFAVPEETTDEKVTNIIEAVLNITGGISPITMLSEKDLEIKRFQKINQHIQSTKSCQLRNFGKMLQIKQMVLVNSISEFSSNNTKMMKNCVNMCKQNITNL